ncbi:FAD-dependent oxidoreductase [Helicovermis profundi]|uniref:FAD-dependent oxidoreductase n=1 Tax=Helicovermis profundi TaxID=3065157 RepID=A0AAU9EPF1_9FIRM|nr:FAD-dependent oxidoreductase [Clostridia bacterium S502]
MKHVVVVGGGVAAKGFLSSAVAIHSDVKYTFIRKTEFGPVPCGIPYAFGTLDSPMDNISPDTGILKGGAELIIDEVIEIDSKEKNITLKSNKKLNYDKLVMAVGSEPIVPPFPGLELENILTIEKDLNVVTKQKEIIKNSKNIVIVGGGFIGVELADEIKNFEGKNVTIIELARNVLSAAFDVKYCQAVEDILKHKNINVITKLGVSEFKGNGKVEEVVLSNGQIVAADMVFLSIGAKPLIKLGEMAGLETNPRAGIITDAYGYTSNSDILAIGDCSSKIDFFSGKGSGIKLASVAAREGRIAALNLFGKVMPESPLGVTSLFSTCVHGEYFAATGMTIEQLEKSNTLFNTVDITTVDKHPTTLPNAKKIEGTFIFAKETNIILGAQLKGSVQVAELINFLGYAVQNKASAYELYTLNYASHPMGTPSPNKTIAHMAATALLKKIK